MDNIHITITPTAYNRIEEMRTQKGNNKLYLRISVSGGGCSGFKYDMKFDEQHIESDVIFDDVLVIDDISAPLLNGTVIDYVVSLMGENFKIENPNAKSGCGCGESFSL